MTKIIVLVILAFVLAAGDDDFILKQPSPIPAVAVAEIARPRTTPPLPPASKVLQAAARVRTNRPAHFARGLLERPLPTCAYQAYFFTTASMLGLAFAKSSGVIAGTNSTLALAVRNHGSARAGIETRQRY